MTSNTIRLEPGKVVFNLVSQTDPQSNIVYTSIEKKRTFVFGSRLEFVGEQRFVAIPIEASSTQWVPSRLEVHKTIEMSDIAEHTKKQINENSNTLNDTSPSSFSRFK